ncbi:mitochondrial 37S ribosomal protein rsm10 [Ascosphaera pollenicola]|nr:mitochondrial 37S ribosomal protein rsm10 [Ascosphaera pollenicola]
MHPLLIFFASLAPVLALPQGGGGGFITIPTPTAAGSSSGETPASTTPGLSVPGIKRDEKDNLAALASILQGLSIPININARSPQTAGGAPELSGAIILRDGQTVKARQASPTPAPVENAEQRSMALTD